MTQVIRAYGRGVQSVQRSGTRRSKKDPIALVIIYFDFFFCNFNSNPQFWEKSQSVTGVPKQSCSVLQNSSWRPWLLYLTLSYYNNQNCIETFYIQFKALFHYYSTEKNLVWLFYLKRGFLLIITYVFPLIIGKF